MGGPGKLNEGSGENFFLLSHRNVPAKLLTFAWVTYLQGL